MTNQLHFGLSGGERYVKPLLEDLNKFSHDFSKRRRKKPLKARILKYPHRLDKEVVRIAELKGVPCTHLIIHMMNQVFLGRYREIVLTGKSFPEELTELYH